MVRLLVVDGSRLTALALARVVPEGVAIEVASSFEDAERRLRDDPPHCAIFIIPPWDLQWERLARLCQDHRPSIPFDCWTAVDGCAAASQPCRCTLGDLPVRPRPLTLSDLEASVRSLLAPALGTTPHPA